MSFDKYDEDSVEILRERLLVAEAANVALASILASLHETAHLEESKVKMLCHQICDMDEELAHATEAFVTNILNVSCELHHVEGGEDHE